jgi:hypothetical protein
MIASQEGLNSPAHNYVTSTLAEIIIVYDPRWGQRWNGYVYWLYAGGAA